MDLFLKGHGDSRYVYLPSFAQGEAKVILVILTQGLLQHAAFAGTLAACPEFNRGNLVPIKASDRGSRIADSPLARGAARAWCFGVCDLFVLL